MLKGPASHEEKIDIDAAHDLFKEFEKCYILYLSEKQESDRLRSANEDIMTEWEREGTVENFGDGVTYYGDIKEGREDEEEKFLDYHFSRPYNNEVGLADSHWKLFESMIKLGMLEKPS